LTEREDDIIGGTKIGGAQAAKTNKAKYGADYYQKIGIQGAKEYIKRQKKGTAKPRGFAAMKLNGQLDKVIAAGRKGGASSRRSRASDYL
jgi:hypothetical protein